MLSSEKTSEFGNIHAWKDNVEMKKYYSVLRNEKSEFVDIKEALFQILEKVGNQQQDCFWISHAWAESLITGKKIARKNFPSAMIQIKHDALWKENQPDYKGAQISFGAEPYMITEWTKGEDQNLTQREYSNLKEIENLQKLEIYLQKMKDGELKMILPTALSGSALNGHALLVTKINGILVIIDNSMEPGAWIKEWSEFAQEHEMVHFYVYDYPENIHV